MTEFQKFKRNLSFALEQLNDEAHFVFYYAASSFYSKASFSPLDFAAYTDDDGRNQVTLNVNDLFTVEAKPEDIKALKFIRNGRSKPWPPVNFTYSKKSEKKVMFNICSQILAPLGGEVILDKRYQDILKGLEGAVLKFCNLGMGDDMQTWHGTPDLKVNGVPVVYRRETEDKFEATEVVSDKESEGDVATTTIGGKVLYKEANLPQAIVVSSFIEITLHPSQQALVPTILIDEAQFRVCLYDSDSDVLLISLSKGLAMKGGLSRGGPTLLWLVINHRLVF